MELPVEYNIIFSGQGVIMRKWLVMLSMMVGFNMAVLADNEDGVFVLDSDATEAQKELVRKGAEERCGDEDEDMKEECVMDYFALHNLDEEAPCD